VKQVLVDRMSSNSLRAWTTNLATLSASSLYTLRMMSSSPPRKIVAPPYMMLSQHLPLSEFSRINSSISAQSLGWFK
jgi:hypothetical protein